MLPLAHTDCYHQNTVEDEEECAQHMAQIIVLTLDTTSQMQTELLLGSVDFSCSIEKESK